VSQTTEINWPVIATLNVADLFHWITITFQHNLRALSWNFPIMTRVTNSSSAVEITLLHWQITHEQPSPLPHRGIGDLPIAAAAHT
jgi:hypothetical protein